MKILIYFVLLGIFSCQSESPRERIASLEQQDEKAWVVYEGRIPLDGKSNLCVEVAMLASEQLGEGSYELKEFLEEDGLRSLASAFKGKYYTLYGETPYEQVVQFRNSSREAGLKRTYLTPGFRGDFTNSQIRMIREEMFRQTDLTVKVQGKNTLFVLDENLRPITTDHEFSLHKRTSKLFTVEGYFRHNGDTADFLEMNTKEKWAVSKLGDYRQAIRQYHLLAKNKFEVTYLKGIAYSIRQTNKEGKTVDALVLKKILQMTAAPSLTEDYNQLSQ